MLPWGMQLTKQVQSNFWQETKTACEWAKEERRPDGDLRLKLISLMCVYIYIHIYGGPWMYGGAKMAVPIDRPIGG